MDNADCIEDSIGCCRIIYHILRLPKGLFQIDTVHFTMIEGYIKIGIISEVQLSFI